MTARPMPQPKQEREHEATFNRIKQLIETGELANIELAFNLAEMFMPALNKVIVNFLTIWAKTKDYEQSWKELQDLRLKLKTASNFHGFIFYDELEKYCQHHKIGESHTITRCVCGSGFRYCFESPVGTNCDYLPF